MTKCTWLFAFVFVSNLYLKYHAQIRTNFVITKFEMCDPKTNYDIKIVATFRTVGGTQYIDANSTLRVPIDDQLRSNFTMESLVGTNYVYLISIYEKHACAAINKYLGEFAYDLERAAQLVPKLCPIPAGRYHFHNHPLHFQKISLQTFPFGILRFTEVATDRDNKVITCFRIIVNNQMN